MPTYFDIILTGSQNFFWSIDNLIKGTEGNHVVNPFNTYMAKFPQADDWGPCAVKFIPIGSCFNRIQCTCKCLSVMELLYILRIILYYKQGYYTQLIHICKFNSYYIFASLQIRFSCIASNNFIRTIS